MIVESWDGTVAALYLFWEYKNRIFFAVYCTREVFMGQLSYLHILSLIISSLPSLFFPKPTSTLIPTTILLIPPPSEAELVELFLGMRVLIGRMG
jgi:hypothetical protein